MLQNNQKNVMQQRNIQNTTTTPFTSSGGSSSSTSGDDLERGFEGNGLHHSPEAFIPIKRSPGFLRRMCCTKRGLLYVILMIGIILLGLRWFIYSYNGAEYVIRMSGPKYNNEKNPKEDLYLVKTNTNPSFLILTLSPEKDVWISHQLITRGWWESAIEYTFEEVLGGLFRKNPNHECNMIDVGGNLGFFSLLSAAYGCKVTVFEIQPEMVNRIRTSATINAFKNIEVKHKAVDKVSGNLVNYGLGSDDNQGSAYTYKAKEETPDSVRTVALDDEFEKIIAQNKRITILKVDVEGKELNVYSGAKKLLKQVDNTVVEVSQTSMGVIKLLIEEGFNKITVLEEPRLVWGYFVKRAPSKTFNNPTFEEVVQYIRTMNGKRDVWLSRE